MTNDNHVQDHATLSDEEPTRAGFVAVIGAPNAGKSTLVNALVGAKVSIVTHKVQTTRSLIRGIVMAGRSQIILVDTPGIFTPKRRLDRAMVHAAWGGANDADLVIFILDAKKALDETTAAILARLKDAAQPCWLVLNKIDQMAKPKLLALSGEINGQFQFQRTFMISALTGDGVDLLRADLARAMMAGPWLYPEDEITDAPMRSLAAEITREQMLERLHQEVPYHATVETAAWTEFKNGSVRIEQTIFVERDSQRQIVLGKGGQTIKAISTGARLELEAIIERRVHLFLFVKVRESWSDDPERYREMGLEFPKDK